MISIAKQFEEGIPYRIAMNILAYLIVNGAYNILHAIGAVEHYNIPYKIDCVGQETSAVNISTTHFA